MDYAARLSQVIGARPGGTEEEQQASFFIEEVMQNAKLKTSIEEFNCNPNYELPRIICCIVSIVLAVLSVPLSLMVIPAFIVCLVMAALYVLEVMGVSPLNNTAKRGISQNVVAKYIPNADVQNAGAEDDLLMSENAEGRTIGGSRAGRSHGQGARKRKIIVVTHYDSGKVCRELQSPFFQMLDTLHWVEIGGIILIPVALLIRMITSAEGTLLIILNVLICLGAVACLLPVLKYVMHQTAPYSDGANNNASGVAVMLEVAKRVGKNASTQTSDERGVDIGVNLQNGAYDLVARDGEYAAEYANLPEGEHDAAEGSNSLVVMHGEEAIREAGVLPAKADLIYEHAADGTLALEHADAETMRIQDAPAKEAAEPDVERTVALEEMRYAAAEAVERRAGAPQTAASPTASMAPAAPALLQGNMGANARSAQKAQSNVPDWFKKGIAAANANKEAQTDVRPIQRSRFADALNAAEAASAGAIEEFESREQADAKTQALNSAFEPVQVPAVFGGEAQGNNLAAQPQEEARTIMLEAQPTGEMPVATVASHDDAASADATPMAEAAAVAPADAAASNAQAVEEVAEQAAVADRTISFIPVAADIPAEMAAEQAAASMVSASSGENSVADSIGKTPEEILSDASAIAEGESTDIKQKKKREIALPSLTGAIEAISVKQDAPLAADAEREAGESRAAAMAAARKDRRDRQNRLSVTLPSTDSVQLPPKEEAKAQREESSDKRSEAAASASAQRAVKQNADARDGRERVARKTKPAEASASSPSAQSSKQKASTPKATKPTKATKPASSFKKATVLKAKEDETDSATAFANAASTSSFEPVGSEFLADMLEDDIIVEDVDDSAYNTGHAGQTAPVSPSYVEMPKSRASRIKGIFGRKKHTEEASFAEAVGIGEDFDARKVGAERGGWESFQNESAEFNGRRKRSHTSDAGSNSRKLKRDSWEDDDAWADDDWNGGAFSKARRNNARTPQGSQTRRDPGQILASMAAESAAEAGTMLDEREQIREFRASSAPLVGFEEVAQAASNLAYAAGRATMDPESDPHIQTIQPQGLNTEVWFVALGADLADNAGIKAFLSEHAREMRGAVIIDIEAMGAGELSLVDEEGTVRRKKASSRMKRYATKAGSALGLRLGSAKMLWRESAAYFTASKGFQTIHVAGMKDGKPAYVGEADDTLDNLSEEKLLEGAAFVLELLHNI